MKTNRSLTTTASAREADEGVFSKLPKLDGFRVKQIELSTQFAALMVYSGETRTELAGKLGWKKSRLSHLFSGRGNPTARTIFELANSLGHDFDVVFRSRSEARPLQPWESTSANEVAAQSPRHNYTVIVQTAEQVARDIRGGNAKPLYVTLDRSQDFTSNESCLAAEYSQELFALSKFDAEPLVGLSELPIYVDV
jgi:transcriptional regulator with XRE-family HTH domain